MEPTIDQIVEAHLREIGAPVNETNKRTIAIHWLMLLVGSPDDSPENLKSRELEFIEWSTKYRP
jgi:hypothetical protein